jgi:hypothetical protein
MHDRKNETVGAADRSSTQSSPRHITEIAKVESALPKERLTKAEANRKNSLKSTGPKTPRGKRYSRNNARTHGFYSKELLISEVDKPEFEEMRGGLMAQLQPSTMLRKLAFDYCAVCQWRVKLALRLEHPQFARQLREDTREADPVEKSDLAPVIERWYGCGRAETKAGIRLIEHAINQFEGIGYFHEDTKADLGRAFGPWFVPWLEEWNTMNLQAILMAKQLATHTKEFGDISEEDGGSSSPASEKVVIDPMQSRHMIVKLLQQQCKILQDLLIVQGRNRLDDNRDAQRSEFNPRFLADANRELQRALEWYMYLKYIGL